MKKVFRIVLDVLAWMLLIFALLITLLVFASNKNNGISSLFGRMPMSVQSDSMLPTMKTGDLIIVKEADLYSLKVGDVITFYSIVDGRRILVTHRITEINEFENTRSFVTKGDNNPVEDSLPAYASDIVGKWKGGGKVLDFLQTKKGFFICILIPLAIFFLFELYKFIVALIQAKKPEITEEEEEEIKRKAVEEYLAAQKKEASDAVDAAKEETKEAAEAVEAATEEASNAVSEAASAGKANMNSKLRERMEDAAEAEEEVEED